MQLHYSYDSKISDKINLLRKKVEGNHVLQKPDRRGRFVRACKSIYIPVCLARAKSRRSLMVLCSVTQLPVRAVDIWKSGGGCEVREIIWDRRTVWELQWALWPDGGWEIWCQTCELCLRRFRGKCNSDNVLCPGWCSNQMSVREDKMRTFDIFIFYRWL